MKKSLFPLLLAALSLTLVGASACKRSDNTGGGGTVGSNASDSGSSRMTGSAGPSYDSPDGKFTITLPPGHGQFRSQSQTQPTAAGDVQLHILQSEVSKGAAVVGYSDFPEKAFEGRTPQKMLEDGRDGALRNIGGTLEKQESITTQGKTGLSIYGTAMSGGKPVYLRFNFILDKPRAYQIGYLAYDRADLDKPEINAYFDSFRLK